MRLNGLRGSANEKGFGLSGGLRQHPKQPLIFTLRELRYHTLKRGLNKASSLRIGSSTAWVTETPGATAGFLAFTGQGLETFECAMDRDERLLAVLGSRLLEG